MRFKDVTIEDLTLRSAGEDASYTGPNSGATSSHTFSTLRASLAGDLNHNGQMDVVSGPFILEGLIMTCRENCPGREETNKKVAFTELHTIDYRDMKCAGLMDIVTGKRYRSHGFRYEENDWATTGAVLVRIAALAGLRPQGGVGPAHD